MTIDTRVRTQGILFDMDGVLIQSMAAVERSWREWGKRFGVPDPDKLEVPHGVRAVDIVRQFKPEFEDREVAEALRVIEDIEVADLSDVTVLPGARELLNVLPPDRWAVVTSAAERLALARLRAVGLPVPQHCITAEMVERGKPDPEPYRRGAELLGFSPADCIVVEDAPSGIAAGRNAGSRVLALLTTHTAAQVETAEWVLRSLADVSVRADAAGLELRLELAPTLLSR